MALCAVFDIGKTNKKLLVFNEQYEVVYQISLDLPETNDEDGFPCEDILALHDFLDTSWKEVNEKFEIKAVNFSGYGATFVYLDEHERQAGEIYNYLKPFDPKLRVEIIENYGEETSTSAETASPFLGNLNSGLQLLRIKTGKPDFFARIQTALHFPQYLSWYFGGKKFTGLTSVGCHTRLWNFRQWDYHPWVKEENLTGLFPEIVPENTVTESDGLLVGTGLHDSSSALIPYLKSFSEPFVLLSTGTWSIALNPFNDTALTVDELNRDCLNFISFEGKQVKASRLFAGQMHEDATQAIASHFRVKPDFYKELKPETREMQPSFNIADLAIFDNEKAAYSSFMSDLTEKQAAAIKLILTADIKQIFIDGGFSKNLFFLQGLKRAFPRITFYAAELAQASALGAALVIHSFWNPKDLPGDLIRLREV